MRTVTLDQLPGEAIVGFGSTGFESLAFSTGARVTLARIAPGGHIGRHRAPVEQLMVVVQGGAVAEAGDERLELAPGTALVLDAGEVHVTHSEQGCTVVVVEAPGMQLPG